MSDLFRICGDDQCETLFLSGLYFIGLTHSSDRKFVGTRIHCNRNFNCTLSKWWMVDEGKVQIRSLAKEQLGPGVSTLLWSNDHIKRRLVDPWNTKGCTVSIHEEEWTPTRAPFYSGPDESCSFVWFSRDMGWDFSTIPWIYPNYSIPV